MSAMSTEYLNVEKCRMSMKRVAQIGGRFRVRGDGPIDRQLIAYQLAMIIECDPKWKPYKANDGKDDCWKLDRANDWYVAFDGDRTFRIEYRYAESGFNAQLFDYVQARLKFERLSK